MVGMQRVVVINSKGGCGKTTIASNLASYFAAQGFRTALFDHDPQGSSIRWLRLRAANFPVISGVAVADKPLAGVTRAFQLRLPAGIERIVVDTPAGLKRMDLAELLRGATAILVPVLPSALDRYVTFDFIRELRILLRPPAPEIPVGIVANRVWMATEAYAKLVNDLQDWGLPLVTSLRDSQEYVTAAEMGLGIHELSSSAAACDHSQWLPLIDWLDAPVGRDTVQRVPGPAGHWSPKTTALLG
jgi:chromosome partitioning protein